MAQTKTEMEALASDLEGSPYRPVRLLARGGMGEVVVAEHVELGRTVVVKLLRANLQGHEDLAERMRAEARVLAQLTHPNLVSVLDSGRTRGGRPYLVTEFLEGQPLHEHQEARGGFLPVADALHFAMQTLAGLEAVHARGFVHRDIKPANLLVSTDAKHGARTLKILDFGIAKALSEKDRVALGMGAPTAEGTVLGTPSAMSPEQASARPVDARTDLYAVGIVLFRMVTGRAPFVGTTAELLLAHVSQPTPRPSSVAPQSIPPALEALLMKSLEKSPGDRFQSAKEMRAAVEKVLLGLASGDAEKMGGLVEPAASPKGADRGRPPGASDADAGTLLAVVPTADDPTTQQLNRAQLPADRRPTVQLLEAPAPMAPPPRAEGVRADPRSSLLPTGASSSSSGLMLAVAAGVGLLVLLGVWLATR